MLRLSWILIKYSADYIVDTSKININPFTLLIKELSLFTGYLKIIYTDFIQ